jgi:hypothetical protein
MKKQITVILGLVLLLGMIGVPWSSARDTTVNPASPSTSGLIHTDLIEQDQFLLLVNDNFTDMGFSGSGTLESPFLVENLSIYVPSTEYGIKAGTGITVNYTIRNCLFWTNVSDAYWGVLLWGGGVIIENCEFDRVSLHTKDLGYLSVRDCYLSAPAATNSRNIEIRRNDGDCEVIGNELRNATINVRDEVPRASVIGNTLVAMSGHLSTGIKTESNNTIISQNHVQGYNGGISMIGSSGYATNATIAKNLIKDTEGNGIYVQNESIISQNWIEGSQTGIRILGNNSVISNNTIHDAADGIYCPSYASNNQIYYNRVARCTGHSGTDRGEGNVWDDGISRGNWWDDAEMDAPYDIIDYVSSEVHTQDRWPVLYEFDAPDIDSPGDRIFMVGSVNMKATWNVSDATPKYYMILVNGTIEDSGSWEGNNITLDMTGWTIATYNVTLKLYDWSDNVAVDTITVVVQEALPTTTTTDTGTTTGTGEGTFPMELALGVGVVAVIVVLGSAIAVKRR